MTAIAALQGNKRIRAPGDAAQAPDEIAVSDMPSTHVDVRAAHATDATGEAFLRRSLHQQGDQG